MPAAREAPLTTGPLDEPSEAREALMAAPLDVEGAIDAIYAAPSRASLKNPLMKLLAAGTATLALAGVAWISRSSTASSVAAASVSSSDSQAPADFPLDLYSRTCPACNGHSCECGWASQSACLNRDQDCCWDCCCNGRFNNPGGSEWYDCDAAFGNWQMEWSEPKKDWCCSKQGRGCRSGGGGGGGMPPLYDCDAGFANWRSGWATEKQEWCCRHTGVACPDVDGYGDRYDCQAGFANWRIGWAVDKKEWCCKNKGLGCMKAEEPLTTTFNCQAAFGNWRSAWSDEKKEYCCRHEGLGCGARDSRYGERMFEPEVMDFDCRADIRNWRTGWAAEKKEYCCRYRGIACGGFNLQQWWESLSPHQQDIAGIAMLLLPILAAVICCYSNQINSLIQMAQSTDPE